MAQSFREAWTAAWERLRDVRQGVWVGLAAVLFFSGLVAGLFGPCVRSKVADKAARYGAEVDIDSVWPSWKGVRLSGVRVTVADIPGVTVEVADVVVGWAGQPVEMTGGKIVAAGAAEDLLRSVEAWRAKHLKSAGGGEGSSRRLGLEGFELEWQSDREAPQQALRAREVRIAREEDGAMLFEAGALSGHSGATRLEVEQGRLRLARHKGELVIKELKTRGLLVEHRFGAAKAAVAAKDAAENGEADKPKPETKPAVHQRVRSARRLYTALLALGRELDARVEGDADIAVAGARAKLTIGEDALNLGPGTLGMRRDRDHLVIALEPAPLEGADKGENKALTFSVRLPLGNKPGKAIEAQLRGGPIWLSLLGVREGDLGLRHVDRASIESDLSVTLPADGQALSLDGRGKLHELSLKSKRIADQPLEDIELAWRARVDAKLDGSEVRIHEAEIDVGALRFLFGGTYRARERDGHALDIEFEIPLVACQDVFASIPKAMIRRLEGMRFAGSLSAKGHARFDTQNLGRHYDVGWDGTLGCRILEVPPVLSVIRLKNRFEKIVYEPDGDRTTMDFGPETEAWVPLEAMSHFIEGAVLTTEDGRFHRHRGFDQEAIVNSLRENLKQRRFVRGASTISMQLAKNLYLPREKTVSRKLQEAVLTMYLEQELTKNEIMELYLNVIEFGPMIYGIGPAASHYFNTTPGSLSLGQALYLGSILLNPKKQHFGAGGAVTPKHMAYLRTLMKIVHKIKRISDAELDRGLRETVVFGSPAPVLSEPDDEGITPSENADPLEQPIEP